MEDYLALIYWRFYLFGPLIRGGERWIVSDMPIQRLGTSFECFLKVRAFPFRPLIVGASDATAQKDWPLPPWGAA